MTASIILIKDWAYYLYLKMSTDPNSFTVYSELEQEQLLATLIAMPSTKPYLVI